LETYCNVCVPIAISCSSNALFTVYIKPAARWRISNFSSWLVLFPKKVFVDLVNKELEADSAAVTERLRNWSLKRLQAEGAVYAWALLPSIMCELDQCPPPPFFFPHALIYVKDYTYSQFSTRYTVEADVSPPKFCGHMSASTANPLGLTGRNQSSRGTPLRPRHFVTVCGTSYHDGNGLKRRVPQRCTCAGLVLLGLEARERGKWFGDFVIRVTRPGMHAQRRGLGEQGDAVESTR
jgi:hypothetical protein